MLSAKSLDTGHLRVLNKEKAWVQEEVRVNEIEH